MDEEQKRSASEEGVTSLDAQLEELGRQFGFHLETGKKQDSDEVIDDEHTIDVVYLYHQADERLYRLVRRHLSLLMLDGYRINWQVAMLPTETSDGHAHLQMLAVNQQLDTALLVLLLVSIDSVESLRGQKEISTLLADEGGPLLLPIALRPVYWVCPFPVVATPLKPIALWRNQEQACIAVARTVEHVLRGIKAFLDEDFDNPNQDVRT